jgi:uncharacterized protein (TIGR02996 family)
MPVPDNTHLASLQVMLREPEMDAHRLVYADWLDTHAGPCCPFLGRQPERGIGVIVHHDTRTDGCGYAVVVEEDGQDSMA